MAGQSNALLTIRAKTGCACGHTGEQWQQREVERHDRPSLKAGVNSMAHRIEVRGPARHGLVGLVLLLAIGAWLAPSLVSSFIGSSGYSYSYFRGGYVEQHKTNLTGHWTTTAMGRYRSIPFFAFAGETVGIGHAVEVRDGSVVVRIRRYVLDIVPEFVWGEQLRDSATSQVAMPVAVSGIYCIELSYIGFEGSVAIDWRVGQGGGK